MLRRGLIFKMEYAVRRLTPADIPDAFLADFGHRQHITRRWVKGADGYHVEECDLMRDWSAEKRIWLAEELRKEAKEGIVLAVFDGEFLVGFCAAVDRFAGRTAVYANLTFLVVDDRFRRKGAGKALFREMCRHAGEAGAEKLFLSAVPSTETIAFYFAMGCAEAVEVPEDFVDTEEDRYLEYDLRG